MKRLALDKYSIDRNRYWELYYFCRQYPEWKRKLSDIYSAYSPIKLSGMPHGSGISDKVAEAGINASELSQKCEMIEQCAREASEFLQMQILSNVAYGVPYEHLTVYTGRRQFYEIRRKFFWLLNNLREKGNTRAVDA